MFGHKVTRDGRREGEREKERWDSLMTDSLHPNLLPSSAHTSMDHLPALYHPPTKSVYQETVKLQSSHYIVDSGEGNETYLS